MSVMDSTSPTNQNQDFSTNPLKVTWELNLDDLVLEDPFSDCFATMELPIETTELALLENSQMNNVVTERSSFMVDLATSAMSELLKLSQASYPLWLTIDGKDVLNFEAYMKSFQREGYLKDPYCRHEASKSSGLLMMNGLELANIFMDQNKWRQYFPTIVAYAVTNEVITRPLEGSLDGTLQLVMHVLSPLVPPRKFCFLRYCKQIEHGLWGIVDVSIEPATEKLGHPVVRKLPSGCIIQDMPNGCGKVTWIEHVEVTDEYKFRKVFTNHVREGTAFGAERWISTLQRISERIEFSTLANSSNPNPVGKVFSSLEGRKNVMRLSQKMINQFFGSITKTCISRRWSTVHVSGDIVVQVGEAPRSIKPYTDPCSIKPPILILSVSTSLWLPFSPKRVFDFLRNTNNHPKWDAFAFDQPMHEVDYIDNGAEPGNRVSLLQAVDTNRNYKLKLQECSIDASGCLIVHSPIKMDVIRTLKTAEDISRIELLPSGFAVIPGRRPALGKASQRSSGLMGSLLTVGFQVLLNDLEDSEGPYKEVTCVAIDKARESLKQGIKRMESALHDHLLKL